MRGHRFSFWAIAIERFWQIAIFAILTGAGATGFASSAEAALYYWRNSDPGFSQGRPATPHHRRQRARPHHAKKVAAPVKESAKPQGPLIIAISIDRQTLKIYDANGFFAETPISTGMKGHPTPMGVFSIIQKHKFHRSNIYSGAPMPFMQRITWSGVAMHAGVLPGYPASHGCIRMPMAFAQKMWNWTKMGARVIVTPGEVTPASFSHSLLAEQKVAPQPAGAAGEPKADAPTTTPKTDKAADAGATAEPVILTTSLELRSSVGHDDAKPVLSETPASRPLREETHTADASGAVPASSAPVTMSDASSSAENTVGNAPPRKDADAGNLPLVAADAASAKPGDASEAEAKPEAATTGTEPAAVNSGDTASSTGKPAESKPAEAAAAEIKPGPTETADKTEAAEKTETKPDQPAIKTQAGSSAEKTEAPASQSTQAGESKIETGTGDIKPETPKAEAAQAIEAAKPDGSVAATTDSRPATPEISKDQTRLPDSGKAAVAKPEPPKPAGRIAVLVSRKDGKLYVRENFKPLFEVPVTIAPSDRLLGTHVFTAQVDKDDANSLRWSVVSLPVAARNAQKHDRERSSRRRKAAHAAPAEVKPLPVPNSPAEALDRITIPPEAMARIAGALSTGGSIVVSDQGINQGETGEGTDFIVSLH